MRKSIRILGSYVDDIDRAMKLFAEGHFDVQPEVEWKGDFIGILLSFFNRFGWASTLIVVYRRSPNTSPAKVHGKCHKSATRPARKMNESPLHASRAETGGRSYSDFTSRIKMDLIHIFPGPFGKASHFAP